MGKAADNGFNYLPQRLKTGHWGRDGDGRLRRRSRPRIGALHKGFLAEKDKTATVILAGRVA